jgi:hypothetical protein
MVTNTDEKFYKRADALINLANSQLPEIARGRVSASFLYGASRFNAWVSASSYPSAEDMANMKSRIIEYFVNEYRGMLEENLTDYINNFDKYMKKQP